MKFTRGTFDEILDEIMEEYFSEEVAINGYGLWEVIEYVKSKYEEEINTLGE